MKKGLIAATCISSLLFGGCNVTMNADDIMSAPKLSITEENIQSIIKENLGENIKLLKPKNHNSPIRFIDIDNDGQDEIFVFHAQEGESSKLRVALFDYKENELGVYYGMEANGFDFDKAYFKDVDGDQTLEIVLGHETENYMPKGLSVYKYNGEDIKEIFNETYDEVITYDMDSDGVEEILLTKRDSENVIATVSLYGNKEGNMIKIDEQEIEYGGVIGLKAGLAASDTVGVFIDSVVGAHSGYTNMFIYRDGKLMDPFKDNENKWKFLFSPYSVISKDVDGDGIIEIANLEALKGYEDSSMAGMLFRTNWYKWDTKDSLKYAMSSIANYFAEYEIFFPEGLDENITLTRDIGENRSSDMFEYAADGENQKIFEILTVIGKENTEGLDPEYKYLKNYKDMVYFVRIIDEELFKELNFDSIIETNFITG